MRSAATLSTLCAGALLGALAPSFADAQEARLREGAEGIAANYPGDAGIEADDDVLFVERFDGNLASIVERWESIKNKEGMAVTDGGVPGAMEAGCLQMTQVGGEDTGCHLYRRLSDGHDLVYARFYVKFAPDAAPMHHFGTHLGGFNPATPWPQGGAGERPDGAKRWTSGIEPYGDSWSWDFYTYWQGMPRHGDGSFWGASFLQGVPSPEVKKGEWICVEVMVKMNQTASTHNGEQAFWIDGELWRHDGQVVSHLGPGFPKGEWRGGWWHPVKDGEPFEGYQWRTDEALDINYIWTYIYVMKAPQGEHTRVWFDNIVGAKSYIGPVTPAKEDAE